MTPGTAVTPLHHLNCGPTGSESLRPGERLTVVRCFETNAGARVALADASGVWVCLCCPVEWLERMEGN